MKPISEIRVTCRHGTKFSTDA